MWIDRAVADSQEFKSTGIGATRDGLRRYRMKNQTEGDSRVTPLLKQVVYATAIATATITAAATATDAYPTKPIRIIVNSAAGALLDVTTRAVAQKMSEDLGQPIIVEDKPGADGQLGIRYVKGLPADGYTLLATANTFAQLPAFKQEPGYEIKDFAGVGMMNEAPLLMVGPPSQPAKSLADLIALAKANPNGLNMASAGAGTSTHMAAALFMQQAGVKMLNVPYKGNAAAMSDVLGGRINAIFDGGNSSGPHVAEGRLRAFGVTSAKRSPAFPEIPTLAEQGLPNYAFAVYMGLLAPAGTPSEVVQRVAKALRQAQGSDAVQERFRKDGAQPGTLSPAEFDQFLRQDSIRTAKVMTDLGITKD